jgi:hypothetical protein
MDKATRLVVMRHNWRASGGQWYLMPGQSRLASFASADEADADCARREKNVQRLLNPFRCGNSLAVLTSFPEPVFLDWVEDAGLTPPAQGEKGERDWRGWWERLAPSFRPEQRAKVWAGLDRLRFYTVVERPDVPVGYALMTLSWQYNDENHYLNEEGGEIQAVYRTRERAEADLGARGNWFPSSVDPLDPESHWRLYDSGNPSYDIIEIELEGLS